MGNSGKALMLLVVGVVLGVAFTYAWASSYISTAKQESYQQGFVAGQSATPPAVEPVALTITQAGGSTFDISSNVSSDGSATAVDKSLELTIANTDNKSATVVIALKNPKTGAEGIPAGLKNAYFNVYAKENGQLKYLYTDTAYTDGKKITIDPASVVTLYIGVSLETAPAGTFADNQTYTMDLFFYQPDANYVQSVSYTVTT